MATSTPLKLFAICAPGIEPLVARELAALGEHPTIEDGGVGWEGDAASMMRANLWLRAASRIVVRVASFEVTAFHELERRAKRLPWDEFAAPGNPVEFRVTSRKSRLYHSDAIAERLLRASGGADPSGAVRPRDDNVSAVRPRDDRDVQLFIVRVVRDQMEISADSSGALLHMRGYRQAVGKAPLRETLAAALLIAADWKGHAPLLDPMCGSGTIPIEAALIARHIPPGLQREFGFMRWPTYDAVRWQQIAADARRGIHDRSDVSLRGSDRDAGAVESARANAVRAEVHESIVFSKEAVSAIRPDGPSGLLAVNPPYGIRVGAGSGTDVRNVYAQLGNTLRRHFSGWRVAMFTPGPALAGQVGIPMEEGFRTTNGGIKVAAMLGSIP